MTDTSQTAVDAADQIKVIDDLYAAALREPVGETFAAICQALQYLQSAAQRQVAVPAGGDYPDHLEIAVPALGSVWSHSNGDTYTVTGYADMFSDSHQKRPPRVIYKSAKTARVWSRELSDWHRAMLAAAPVAGQQDSAQQSEVKP